MARLVAAHTCAPSGTMTAPTTSTPAPTAEMVIDSTKKFHPPPETVSSRTRADAMTNPQTPSPTTCRVRGELTRDRQA